MRIVTVLGAVALVASCAASANAQAVLRFSWGADANAYVSNQNWIGPVVYSMNLSVTGLSGKVDRIVVHAEGPNMENAWRPLSNFYVWSTGSSGGLNCFDSASRVTGSAILPGATPIPGGLFSAGSHGGITNPMVTFFGFEVDISPPLMAEPAKRYGIGLVNCDLVDATVGYANDRCPWAEWPFCIQVTQAMAHLEGQPYNTYVPIALGTDDVITWQGGYGMGYCLSTTPTRTSTWGSLKSRYR